MPDQSQALFSYPGIMAVEDWDFTDVAGVYPAVGMMTVYAQPNPPPFEGDLTMAQDGRVVIIRKMRIDLATWEAGSGGQVALVRFFDERWKWHAGYVISGIYNSRLLGTTLDTVGSATSPDNTIDPLREKTPKELVDMLFDAMDVTNYDASLVDSDPSISADRPYCEWDVARPAQELQRLLDGWGVRLVPQRSTGKFVICRTGDGANLPDGIPYEDPSEGIDPKEIPDGVRIYGAPIKYQVRLELEAIGKEIWDTSKQPSTVPKDPNAPRPTNNADGSWKAIGDLTYTPNRGTAGNPLGTWEDEIPGGFQSLAFSQKVKQPDGTYVRAYDLAKQYIGKAFRPKESQFYTVENFTSGKSSLGIAIPGYVDPHNGSNVARRRQLILSDVLCAKYTNTDGVEVQAKAFCDFIGQHPLWTGAIDATAGTRLDKRSDSLDMPDEVVTFSIDVDQGIVCFSHPLTRKSTEATALHPTPTDAQTLPAKVWLTCAVMVRDPVTWQPIRYTRERAVPGSTSSKVGKFVLPVIKDDIQLLVSTEYSIDSDGNGTVTFPLDNKSQCDIAADYYIDSTIKTFETPNARTRRYIGIWPIDMDGAINQVSYVIGKSGADTKVSRGTEHDIRIPPYREMQRRNLFNLSADKTEKNASNGFTKGGK